MNLTWLTNRKLLNDLAEMRERNSKLEVQLEEIKRERDEFASKNELLRIVCETIPDQLAIIDKNYHILYCNWHGGYGYVPESNRSGTPLCYEAFYGRKAPCEDCHSLKVFMSGEPVIREKLNPKIGWMKIHAYPVLDDSGKATMVVEHIREITEKRLAKLDLQRYREHLVEMVDERTAELNQANKELTRENAERREAEEALQASEEKFRAVTETSPAAIFLYQGERFIYCNHSAERMFGYSQEELLAMKFWEIIHPDFMELVKSRGLARQQGVQVPSEYEFKYVTKAGEERWGLLSAKTMQFAGKRIGISVFVDITERKLAEELLRDSEEQFRVMTASAQDAIVMMDNEGRFSYWNEAAERIFGYTKQETIGKVVHEILPPPRYREDYLNAFPAWHDSGHGAVVNKTVELTALRKDGCEIPVELSLSSVKIKGKWNAIAIVRDITSHKRAEKEIRDKNVALEQRSEQLLSAQEELIRKEKLAVLGQLSGSVAHEMRNPLAVISNAVYFLKALQMSQDERIKEYLEIISEEVGNAGNIITNVLDFSRTKTPNIVPTKVSQLVKNVLDRCAVPDGITISTNLPESLPLLKVDPLQIYQVMQNLITNAIQAMPQGGSVTISARSVHDSQAQPRESDGNVVQIGEADFNSGSGFIEISVLDTGEGISPENMKKLFQPLFTTKVRGIGLGLTLCRNLTEANGGCIAAESRQAEGTLFRVTLPVVEKFGT